jgi:phosphoglycerate dehydrogenase-like enzyme
LYRALDIQHSEGVGGNPPWGRAELSPHCYTLAGTEAVILGYGKIGRTLGAKLQALGVKVTGFGRSNISLLPEAVRTADWLVVLLPSDTGTDGIVNAKLLGRMKRGAVLINAGRGNAVDEIALASALEKGRLGAAFIDVFAEEPLRQNSPLAKNIPGLYRFPHSSAFSPDYLKRFFRELAEAVGELK